jgi:hypothetical protein
VTTVPCDVSDRAQVAALIEDLSRAHPPLGGIVHAAGVLDDGLVETSDAARLRRVFAPKVAGAKNLHELTRNLDLEGFILFSSIASVFGSAGQSAYAAANAYLDALARRRRSLGLPALAVDFGPWAKSGMAARLDEAKKARIEALGFIPLQPEEALDALDEIRSEGLSQALIVRCRWDRLLAASQGRPPPLLTEFMHAVEESPSAGAILDEIRNAPALERRVRLLAFLEDQLGRVLGYAARMAFERDRRFPDLGVDSLLAVDLKNRIEAALRIPLAASLAFDHPTLDALADHLLSCLASPAELPATVAPATIPEYEAEIAALATLPEEELARRLSDQILLMEHDRDRAEP